MPDWVERAETDLMNALQDGSIELEEYNEALRNLHAEARQLAEEAGRDAYDRAMGDW